MSIRILPVVLLVLAGWSGVALAQAKDEPRVIVGACDPASWITAEHGRASLLRSLGVGEDTLLVITGGALSSSGLPAVGVAAYPLDMLSAAGFDAVNLAHRDLVGDPRSLLDAIAASRVPVVSASFRMPEGQPTPWAPFVIASRGGTKTAFIGIAETSPSLDLPGSGAIGGVIHVAHADALRAALAAVDGKAERIVLLADAPLSTVAALLREFPAVHAALVSARGATTPEVYEGTRLCGVPASGRAVVTLTLSGNTMAARQALVAAPSEPSAAYREVRGKHGISESPAVAVAPRGEPADAPAVLASLAPGTEYPCRYGASNRAVTLTVRSIALLDAYGGRAAPEGHRYLAVATHWQNILTPEVVREQLVPVAYRIPELADHMYAVADGRTQLPKAGVEGLAGVLDWGPLQLDLPGSTRDGRLLFLVPSDAPLDTLELRFYDFAHGPIFLPLVRSPQPPADVPALARGSNEVLAMTLHRVERQVGPDGSVRVTLELRARSTLTMDADATAYDPKAKPGDRIEIGTVADWKDWRRHTQLLVDGEFAHAPFDPVALPEVPRFLPDVATGGRLDFRVPASAKTMVLLCGMPNARLPSGEVIRPKPITLAWEAAEAAPPDRAAAISIEDDVFVVEVTGQRRGALAGLASALVLDVTVKNRGERPETFQTFEQLRCVDSSGGEHGIDPAASARVDHPPLDLLWIPEGQRRSFQVVFALPAGEGKPRLSYRGLSMAQVYDLSPQAAADEPVAPPPAEEGPPVAERPPVRPADVPAGTPTLQGGTVAGFRPVAADLAGAEVSVLDARTATTCLGENAPEGRTFLMLQLRWRRTGERDWNTGNLSDRIYLHRRGLYLHDVWNWCWNKEGYLPRWIGLGKEQPEFVCTVVFEIAPADLPGSSLVLGVRDVPTATLPIAPAPAREPLPALAQAENELIALRVHGIARPDEALREELARSVGEEKTLVALKVSVTPKPGVFEIGYLARFGQLIAGGEFPCPPFFRGPEWEVEGWPALDRSPRFLPGVTQHGVLLYALPDPECSLALELSFPDRRTPDGKPLASPLMRLDVRAGRARPTPEPLARVDSDEWQVEFLGIERLGEPQYAAVTVDVRLRRLATDKGDVVNRGAVRLLDETAHQVAFLGGTERYEPDSSIYFPPGAVRRVSWSWRLPDRGARLWMQPSSLVRGKLVEVPNPWVSDEQERLAARAPCPVVPQEKDEVPYVAPPLLPEPEAKGLEGVGITGQQVNEAIRKGARYLMHTYKDGFDHRSMETALVILALLHSRELQKEPELYAKAVDSLERHEFSYSYDAALTIMGLAWIDADRYRPRIRRIAQALVDGQCQEGCWNYISEVMRPIPPEGAAAAQESGPAAPTGIEVVGGEPIPGWPGAEKPEEITLRRELEWTDRGGDNSCSQYAILGLLAAGKAGVKAPRETWERALAWYVGGHNRARGWGYGSRSSSYGSMTTAGLAGLAVTSFFLGESTPEADAALREGADWLGRNFLLEGNPSSNGYHYYYLYGLERAGRLLGKEFLGGYEWYPEGARYLVRAQKGDGSWEGDTSPDTTLDTSYALLFLTLATEKLGATEEVPTGPGRLKVEAGGMGGSVLFILDASGSMGADLGAETRFDAARRVVLDTLQGGGAGLEVALRVYGHRHAAIRPQADEDTELVIGFGPADRPELAQVLGGLRFRGKTPLTLSLKEALADLQRASGDKRRVVLLTDGLESTRNADPVGAAAALKAAGARLDVVGLCVDNMEMLERMAAAGGGSCYGASDADQLLSAFRTAVTGSIAFRVLDAAGKKVAEGESGAEVALPAGPYVVEIDMPDGKRTVNAWVHQDRTTTIAVRAGG